MQHFFYAPNQICLAFGPCYNEREFMLASVRFNNLVEFFVFSLRCENLFRKKGNHDAMLRT